MRRRLLPASITGVQVVSWAGFWLLISYSIASMLLANVDLSGSSVAGRLAVSVGASIVLFGMLAAWAGLARRWPALNARSWRVITTFAVLALVRALLVAVALDQLGITQSIDWPRRLIGSVAGFTTVIVLIDIVLGSIRRHRQRVSLLLARQDAARKTRDEAIEEIESQRAEALDRITRELISRVESLERSSPDTALASLRSAAEDLVRPLSHELAKASPEILAPPPVTVRPRFDPRAFLTDATTGAPLSPAWVAVLFMLFGGPFLISVLPWGQALIHLVIGFVAIWIALTLVNLTMVKIVPARPLVARVFLLFFLLLAAALLLALSSVMFINAPRDVLTRIAIGDFTLLIELCLALVIAHAARLQDATIERRLEDAAFELDWASTRARCIQWRQQRWLARAMHGPVQGAIATAATRLERAIVAHEANAALIDELRSQLVTVFATIRRGVDHPSDLQTTVDEFAQTWVGVCEITLDVQTQVVPVLRTDHLAEFAAREIISESCWNALRHSRPTRIDIRVALSDPRVLVLEVTDNGPADSAPAHGSDLGATGLGTRMIRDLCLSWDRRHTTEGTTLVSKVPVEPT